ncbi:MAG: tRNA (adenosine(37)-N6)-dimethylallyltransferase MiaA [Burkholderiales bacterium]|nr:tRNA (adenosine(37)-N6)-dimethylallyltransferase MiaA [Burkholderiales bacterium]
MTRRPVAFALLGPTASGKSALALALAAEFPLEIVSVDSAQVYRGLDIGTAKPSAGERARVAHHLIDIAEPTERYSAGRFRADAIAAVQAILARGRIPLLVGGTMLYYRALVAGLDALPAAHPAIRAAIEAEARARGWPALHAELAREDPAAAARIAPRDAQRIQRALEVLRATGTPISRLQRGEASRLPFALRGFALAPPDRAELHRRIAARLDAMLAAGLVEELRELRRRYRLDPSLPSMRTVGYRQAWRYLEGEIDAAQLREQALAATRQLAKRQLTWLRAMPELAPATELRAALSRATG